MLQTLLVVALLAQGRRRRLAETRLLESEDRMRLAASAANLGLWRWDSRNKVWMTDHCRRMLGLTVDAEPTIGALLAKVHNEDRDRSEEHTSELQSLMRNSYAVFCLKKKKHKDISI